MAHSIVAAVWLFAHIISSANPFHLPVEHLRVSGRQTSLLSEKSSSFRRMHASLTIENDISNQNQFDYGCVTYPGTDPDRPQKVNQDGSFFSSSPVGSGRYVTFFGVMDGHGLKGHGLVQYLQQQLPLCLSEYLRSALLDCPDESGSNEDARSAIESPANASTALLPRHLLEEFKQDLVDYAHADPTELYVQSRISTLPMDDGLIRQAIVDSFLSAQYQASQSPNVPSSRSGTTCICCVLIDDRINNQIRLYTACVGDSRAILISNDKGTSRASWKVQSLTETTTVKIDSERNRINSCEGRIDASGNVFYGPIGIAMSRSLGNTVMLRAGILPIPIITLETLSGNKDSYVCAGTDGVFDVLSNEQVVNILKESIDIPKNDGETKVPMNSLREIANNVCNQAKLAWLDDLPIETKVDDITFAMLNVVCRG